MPRKPKPYPYDKKSTEILHAGTRIAEARYAADVAEQARSIVFHHKEMGGSLHDFIWGAATYQVNDVSDAVGVLSESRSAGEVISGEKIPRAPDDALVFLGRHALYADLRRAVVDLSV